MGSLGKRGEIMAQNAKIYSLEGMIDCPELLDQLKEAITELEIKMKAFVPINRNTAGGSRICGYGVNKIQRSIAADRIISIAKAIKILKGW